MRVLLYDAEACVIMERWNCGAGTNARSLSCFMVRVVLYLHVLLSMWGKGDRYFLRQNKFNFDLLPTQEWKIINFWEEMREWGTVKRKIVKDLEWDWNGSNGINHRRLWRNGSEGDFFNKRDTLIGFFIFYFLLLGWVNVFMLTGVFLFWRICWGSDFFTYTAFLFWMSILCIFFNCMCSFKNHLMKNY